MEINPTNNPDVTGDGTIERELPDDVADSGSNDDDDERDDAVISADDTGLLSQQRLITEEEIEHPGGMGTP